MVDVCLMTLKNLESWDSVEIKNMAYTKMLSGNEDGIFDLDFFYQVSVVGELEGAVSVVVVQTCTDAVEAVKIYLSPDEAIALGKVFKKANQEPVEYHNMFSSSHDLSKWHDGLVTVKVLNNPDYLKESMIRFVLSEQEFTGTKYTYTSLSKPEAIELGEALVEIGNTVKNANEPDALDVATKEIVDDMFKIVEALKGLSNIK